MDYYELAFQFLLENKNTLFFNLPLEINALIMKYLFHSKLQNVKNFLEKHYQNLVVKEACILRLNGLETFSLKHSLPQFMIIIDIEHYTKGFVKELIIRRKRITKKGFWQIKSKLISNDK